MPSNVSSTNRLLDVQKCCEAFDSSDESYDGLLVGVVSLSGSGGAFAATKAGHKPYSKPMPLPGPGRQTCNVPVKRTFHDAAICSIYLDTS